MHGTHDIGKFSVGKFREQKNMKRSDYVIICGDFGLIWDGSAEDEHWIDWLEKKPWTTLWIDGNHENFNMLKNYPEEEWNGGTIQRIREHVLHLCRGNVFELEGKKLFAFGGAESHDKKYRTPGRSIWEEELPSKAEIARGRQALEAAGWKVDIVVTHSLPGNIQETMFAGWEYGVNRLTDFFDEVEEKLDFGMWFSGHYHHSMAFDEKHFLIYNNIVRLTDDSFERVYPKSFDAYAPLDQLLDIK